ncbi:hypothetical protein F5I97DRAFT_716938 [Phlebopus sp. FC_14]|nr:hypothetical protein F5I97DRAFT_716938 [Phlebopus sp. FC_14]
MEAGFQYRSRTLSTPHHDCLYTPMVRSKTAESTTAPYSVSRVQFPRHRDTTHRYEASSPVRSKHMTQTQAWVMKQDAPGLSPHKQTTEEWVNEQIHLADRSNRERRGKPVEKEVLRQQMWDELMYEYEAGAYRWMKYEAEMRRKMHEREREEARRRVVQEDISRIQARVRQRRDSERQTIADERRRNAERAKEKERREQARLDKAIQECWNSYESRWAILSGSSEALSFHDIPWPVYPSPLCAQDITVERICHFIMHPVHSSNQSRRERIRTALLRWHPDRFRRMLQRVTESDRRAVEEGVGIVARCLNDLLAKEGKVSRQGK